MSKPNLKPSRFPSRQSRDVQLIHEIMDTALYCVVAWSKDGKPHQIPTGFCRIDDDIFIHASSKSHFIDSIIDQEVSFSTTLLDGLVLAPTAFDHSFNYRSVIGYAKAAEVTEREQKLKIFRAFTDRYIPGRSADVGDPSIEQMDITKIVRLSLDHAAVKMREGDIGIEGADKYGKWAGIIPLKAQGYDAPQPDTQLAGKIPMPEYLKDFVKLK